MSVVVLSMALTAAHEIDPAGAQSALTVGDGQYQIESTIIGLNRTGVTGLMGRKKNLTLGITTLRIGCLLYTSPSPRDLSTSRMPSSA